VSISLIIACRSPIATESLCVALKRHRKHFNVVGTALSSKELLKQVAQHRPNVALVSAELQDGPTAGLRVLRELHASNNGTRVVVLLDSPDPGKVVDAFSAGARGVISATSSLRVLSKCLRCVHAGQSWANSTQLQWIFETLGEREPARIVSAKGTPLLTKREEQIAHMVAEGLPNREISSKLDVSPHTVKNHLFRIYEKLGISNRVELVLYAHSSREKSREPRHHSSET
jgi:DNA-binding NarL/FixJ family response regulator